MVRVSKMCKPWYEKASRCASTKYRIKVGDVSAQQREEKDV